MKKRNYMIAVTLAFVMAVSIGGTGGATLSNYAVEAADVRKNYDLPDKEELEANKALKEVVEQWEETGEYPDYLASVVFCGESLYPVIQLTDISEVTKRDFLDKVGFEHERWIFQKVEYSRNELLEICEQVKTQFADDKRIEKIVVSELAEQGHVMIRHVVKENLKYEHRPTDYDQEIAKVWILAHNEYEFEVRTEAEKLYEENMVEVSHNMDDAEGEIVTEEAIIGERVYKRQYQINDIRDWVYTLEYGFWNMGDFNGNGSIDLEDAQEVLKAALKITEISEEKCFGLRYSEDHTGLNLDDAKAILLRALKIEDDWIPHVQLLHSTTLYRSLEWGRIDMPVEQQVFHGREELLTYIKELENPELEKYVNSLSDSYLQGDILLTATPVYAEDLDSVYGSAPEMKVTDNSWGIIAGVIDNGGTILDGANQYYIELSTILEDVKKKPYEKFYLKNKVTGGEEAKMQSYISHNPLEEDTYVITSTNQLSQFKQKLREDWLRNSGFNSVADNVKEEDMYEFWEELKKDSEFFEESVLIVNVSKLGSFVDEANKVELSYKKDDENINFFIERERYITEDTIYCDCIKNSVDVITVDKDVIGERKVTVEATQHNIGIDTTE